MLWLQQPSAAAHLGDQFGAAHLAEHAPAIERIDVEGFHRRPVAHDEVARHADAFDREADEQRGFGEVDLFVRQRKDLRKTAAGAGWLVLRHGESLSPLPVRHVAQANSLRIDSRKLLACATSNGNLLAVAACCGALNSVW